MRAILAAASAVLALCGTGAGAATFQASATQGASCADFDSNSTGAAATCPDAFAISTPGLLRAEANSELKRVGGSLVSTTGRTNSQASVADTLFFGVDAGTLTLTVDLLGSVSVSVLAGTNTRSTASIAADISGRSTTADPFQLYEFDASQSVYRDAITNGQVTETNGDPSPLQDIVFSFTDGQLDLFYSLQADAGCTSILLNSTGTCTVSASYTNSLRLTGGVVRDESGAIIDNGILSSLSGFDYNVGVQPHDREMNVVPLPAALPMLLAGLGGLGLVARRRARSA